MLTLIIRSKIESFSMYIPLCCNYTTTGWNDTNFLDRVQLDPISINWSWLYSYCYLASLPPLHGVLHCLSLNGKCISNMMKSICTPHPAPDLRHCHNLPLYRPPTRTQVHLGSYFPSNVPLWNFLPQHAVSASTQLTFKHSLKLSSPHFAQPS